MLSSSARGGCSDIGDEIIYEESHKKIDSARYTYTHLFYSDIFSKNSKIILIYFMTNYIRYVAMLGYFALPIEIN